VSDSVFVQPLPTDSKQQWRRWAKQQRSLLVKPTLEYEVVKTLRGSSLYQNARNILTYLAFGSEPSLAALNQDGSKTFFLTRVWEDGRVTVHPLNKELETHRYGFLQPRTSAPRTDMTDIDLVFVPGLCFDDTGTRLGYGKGYYDRLLPALQHATVVGVVPEALIVERLPRETFDVPMGYLASEQAVRQVKK
jgi:5-formyltetrahydrofolate cyclo-ligase